jgi:hypothetical protein
MKNLTLQSIREKKEAIERKKTGKLIAFLEELKKEMILNKVYYSKAKFSCFSDNIFTYSYLNHSYLFTFDIICEDTLFDKMTIKDLLSVKRIGYFDNGIYDKKTREKLGGISYSIFDEEELTEEEVRLKNIDYYNEVTKGIPEEHLWKGFYLSDGVYLQSDGTFSGVD